MTVKENVISVVPVESITVEPNSVEVFVDDSFTFTYTVLPENADDKSVDNSIEDESIVQAQQDGSYKALKAGTTRIVVTSKDNPLVKASVSVTVKAIIPVTIAFASNDVVLSKLRDVTITLTTNEPDKLSPGKVELEIPEHANEGWGAIASASKTDATGLRWTVRANYVGNYTLRIRYNGVLQNATCNVHVPAEYPIRNGWQWMSFYAVNSSSPYNPQAATLYINEDNFVSDIRTQTTMLHYDPDYKYFGNLEHLSSDNGFKVNAYVDEDHEGQMLFNLGYASLITGAQLPRKEAVTGYSWQTYPHENDHLLTTLAPYLSQTADEGDMIIGQDDFAEFDGQTWNAADDFRLEAGHGYIYYSARQQAKTINWGPATLKPEALPEISAGSRAVKHYADVMPVVAHLDASLIADGSTVVAYVDGEPRAYAAQATDGLLHFTVEGRQDDVVTFGLTDASGQVTPLPISLPFATRAGSHRQPVELSAPSVELSSSQTAQDGIYDLQGRRINSRFSPVNSQLGHGVYLVNGKKYIK